MAEATRTAAARHHELDSLKARAEDSVWNLSAAPHKQQLAACRRGVDPLNSCLLVSGWPLRRVNATSDSLWEAESRQHLYELHTCERRRDVALASCLTLYYKWDSDRALHVADERGWPLVVLLGHPSYYPRFGFAPASGMGVRLRFDVPDEVFMALALRGYTPDHRGLIRFTPAFAVAFRTSDAVEPVWGAPSTHESTVRFRRRHRRRPRRHRRRM